MLLDRSDSQLLVVDVQSRLAPAIPDAAEIEARCGILLQAARILSVPILISEQYPKGLGHTLPGLAALAGTDRVYEKVEFSCFANAPLRQALTEVPGRNTVVCGMEAHVCVLQTALEMAGAGHRVTLVADAVSSRRRESRGVAIDRMRAAGIDVVTTEMVLFEWLRSAADPAFKAISALIR